MAPWCFVRSSGHLGDSDVKPPEENLVWEYGRGYCWLRQGKEDVDLGIGGGLTGVPDSLVQKAPTS